MTTTNSQLRRRQYSTGNPALDRALGELARDVSDALDQQIALDLVEFTDVYQEPLYVGFDHEPKMVVCGRARADATPDTTAVISSSASYTYDASNRRVVINEIDGLTVGTRYRFNFLMVG